MAVDKFTATAGQTVFVLTQSPGSVNSMLVALDGALLYPSDDYALAGNVLTLLVGALAGQRLLAQYGSTGTPAVATNLTISAGTLVTRSLRLIGAIATGEVPTAAELNDGLGSLNDLLEIWSTQNLAVWDSSTQTFPTVAGQAVYTIGPGGNWDTARPIRISGEPTCTFNGVDFPITPIGQGEYDLIGLKTQRQPIIEKLLYVNDNPLGIITLWPVPSGIVNITINPDRVLSSVTDQSTVLAFPPGYMLALRYNLGILLAPDYGRTITPEIAGVASTSFAALKRANKVKRSVTFDGALVDSGPAIWQTGV